jgi:hypothetical protein
MWGYGQWLGGMNSFPRFSTAVANAAYHALSADFSEPYEFPKQRSG